jgi:DNA-binding GntR family transcriptional regulator
MRTTGPSPRAKGIETTRTSSSDQVALYIRRLIFDGDLRPGERVPQDEVAKALGVSRIPVREALIALEREGWLTIELHRGAFILPLDADSVRDHYEVFGLVYGLAARRALQRSEPAELAATLEEIVDQLADVTDPEEFTRLTVAFHRAVVAAARSPRVNVVIRTMSVLVPGDFFSLVPEAMTVERESLPIITRALASGNASRAADEYQQMMRAVGDNVIDLFAERGLFSAPATEPA